MKNNKLFNDTYIEQSVMNYNTVGIVSYFQSNKNSMKINRIQK